MDSEQTLVIEHRNLPTKLGQLPKPSMLYNALPTALQSRIPALPSVRRTLSGVRARAGPTKDASEVTDLSCPVSPPPEYSTRPSSAISNSSSSSNRTSLAFGDDISIQENISEGPQSSMSTPLSFSVSESRTSINWKYGNQGINLLTQSYAESHSLKLNEDETSTILSRQLYIHGLTYLLRGLPSNLRPEEMVSLQAALQHSMANLQSDTNAHAMVPLPPEASTPLVPPPDASLLHRVTAILVFQAFVLIQFLLPYIKLFLGHTYRFERKHKVTQRLVNNGIMTADALRKRSLQLSHTICQMNDGKVGQAVNDLTLWWVRGLTGGLQQGITEGVTMLSHDRSKGQKDRLERMD